MTRRIADHKRTRAEGRLRAFLRIERAALSNPWAKALHRHGSPETTEPRLREFVRIERGRKA